MPALKNQATTLLQASPRLCVALHAPHRDGGDYQPLFHGPSRRGQLARVARPLGGASRLCLVQHQPIRHLQRNVLSVLKSDCEALPRGGVLKTKSTKPVDTRWMVVWEGSVLLNDHWEELKSVFCAWVAKNMLATSFNKYWLQGH